MSSERNRFFNLCHRKSILNLIAVYLNLVNLNQFAFITDWSWFTLCHDTVPTVIQCLLLPNNLMLLLLFLLFFVHLVRYLCCVVLHSFVLVQICQLFNCLPGHLLFFGLHFVVSLSLPSSEQSFPPFWGGGLLHNLSRVLMPFFFPHVLEHALHFPHGP